MSGVVAFEGELNSIVKEYLDFSNLQRTLGIFEEECIEKGKPVGSTDSKPKVNQRLAAVQKETIRLFQEGNKDRFFQIWNEHIPQEIRNEDAVAQKLEFYLHIYFAIYPLKMESKNQSEIEENMNSFKVFLETQGAALSQTTEFLPFYALPFVPNPKTHPSYKELFSDRWVPDLQTRLQKFLTLALQSTPQPRLFELYKGGNGKDLQIMQQQVVDAERRATSYLKRSNRVQADYHNLIGITAELVDSLEATVQGRMVTPEYLQKICMRLFSNQIMQSVDLTRPGTAASMLRQSVLPPPGRADDVKQTLDYDKVKKDLTTAPDRRRALLLQALRWRLTKTIPGDKRDNILNGFIVNDILGCAHTGQYRKAMLENLTSHNSVIKQYTARLFNTVASLCDGRSYLSQNTELLRTLMLSLQSEDKDNLTRENVLGCLQKLSLRRHLQTMMIEEDVIMWLVSVLDDSDSLSDYTLEYSVALLMNLCLRTTGKRKCAENAHDVLKVLSDLLGHDNQEIIPYVNGAMYSILAIPSIRDEAKAMGMEEILKCFIKDGQPDMNRQIEFIIKQLNSTEEPEDGESDDEEDEDEEEQDAMEADLDKQEALKPQTGELIGEQLLTAQYMTDQSPPGRKRRPTDAVMQDEVLMRPVTPGQMKDGQAPRTSRPATASGQAPSRAQSRQAPRPMSRPPTRSGSRPNTGDETARVPPPVPTDEEGSETISKAMGSKRQLAQPTDTKNVKPSQKAMEKQGEKSDLHEYSAAFSTRPRIPRTPDTNSIRPTSRGSVGEGPPPQPKYSNTLPTSRPNSAGSPGQQNTTSTGGPRPSTGGAAKRGSTKSKAR